MPMLGLRGLLLSLGLAFGVVPAQGSVPCRVVAHAGGEFTVCEVDLAEHRPALVLNDQDGRPYGNLMAFRNAEKAAGRAVQFAMNAGMYHRDLSPVGLYVEDGQEVSPVVLSDGPGNFHLLPNGVLAWNDERAVVMESKAYARSDFEPLFATQSGPMLVIDGALHPRFLEDGTSRKVRNGVGVSEDGRRLTFAISNGRVNFHTFGTLFRDALQIDNALYLDGTVSSLYAPSVSRADGFWPAGPIVAVTK